MTIEESFKKEFIFKELWKITGHNPEDFDDYAYQEFSEMVIEMISEEDEVSTPKLLDTEQNFEENPTEITSEKKPSLDFVVSGKQLLEMDKKELPYLVKPILPKTGLVAIAGSSDTGKSSILRQLAVAIVTGETSFLGFEVFAEHKRVVYVCTEDDKNSISMLLQKQNPTGLTGDQIENLGYIFDTDGLKSKLNRVFEKHKVDCLIVDAFADLYGGDINSTNKVREFLHFYGQIAQKYECLVIFLHHTGKRTELLPPSKNNLLGSQGFEAKMRLVIELRKDLTDSDIRHLCIVKGNYLPEDYKDRSFKLIFDDTMSFSYTNERVPFEDLYSNGNSSVSKNILKQKAIELSRNEKLSVRKIEEYFKGIGESVKKSTIANWLNDAGTVSTDNALWYDFTYEDDEEETGQRSDKIEEE